ncbi:probable G-protein coupled receptor Mth-like 1 isoform X2 [Homarus americanus]|uniref:probable G-protein coupled receptor Mth-like 1 isoform X2 n=1 Tax=Homarus americanus TaxID=6706 RepID=UPI001C45E9F6|nr:probable G-protein coupled receptor Mth-like 1 isoform X2 [Homarus americanus]
MCIRVAVLGVMVVMSTAMPRASTLPPLANTTSQYHPPSSLTSNESLTEAPTSTGVVSDPKHDTPDTWKEVGTVTPLGDVDMDISDEVHTTPPLMTATSSAGPGASEGTSKTVPTRMDQLVRCQCGPEQVLTADGCRSSTGIYIDGESKYDFPTKKLMTDLNVIVHDLHCAVDDDHREMNFTKGQFFLRDRGDIVLNDAAGYLSGLRINNYCVIHYLDYGENLTWMLKACIPPPSVPRCCPPGEALKDTLCHPAHSPDLLMPPIAAGTEKKSVEWPVIRNHYSPVTCTQDPMKTLSLNSKDSVLVAIPTGMVHIWDQPETVLKKIYSFPPDFCVDGQQNPNGSVTYSANLCYSNPRELHHKKCDGKICVRKCCKLGEIMNSSIHRCVPNGNITFIPPFTSRPPSYETVTGLALCSPQTRIKNFTLDGSGYITYRKQSLSPTEYCMDTFFDGFNKYETSALGCVNFLTTLDNVREILYPICQFISLFFMSLTVVCYCKVPELLKNGGWYQLWHVLSLILAFSSNICQSFLNYNMSKMSCIAIALAMQYGYLATFFWLSVLCFEVWRKIRSLARYLPPSSVPVWVYPLYAFGGPFAIGIITVCMQFLAPDNVPGIIKPYIGESKCWFIDEMSRFLYFYGPIALLFIFNIIFIALTYWNYKVIEENSAVLRNLSKDESGNESATAMRTSMEQTYRRRDYIAEAVTDVLNTLQGFFIMVIFLANKSKRRQLKKKYPGIFVAAKQLFLVLQKVASFIMCKNINGRSFSSDNCITSQVSRKLSTSSIVSNFSTLTSSLKHSSASSFHVTSIVRNGTKRSSSVNETENGIITISHSPLSSSPSGESESSCPCVWDNRYAAEPNCMSSSEC